MYEKYVKRILDLIVSLTAAIVLLPLMMILLLIGAVVFKGNPLFIQLRPGKIDKKTGKEKIFGYIKLKTMNDNRDKNGNLLSDQERLCTYGRIMRALSLDEIFSLFNIIKGDMSIVGPRPLLVKYLPLYTQRQRHRHDVRPGLTGYAQVNGRNLLSFEERFELDLKYINNISFINDIKIVLKTVKVVLTRQGINSKTSETMEEFSGEEEKEVVDV